MILYYYLLLAFGALLLLYTATRWIKTKRIINENNVTFLDRVVNFGRLLLTKAKLWGYYFVAGNNKNWLRNSILVLIVFLVASGLNIAFIKMSTSVFTVLFWILFVVLVWKLGQRRTRKLFEASFPEVIQVLNSATSAGSGLLQALERCGKDIAGQLGDEFKMIYKRLSIGEDPMSVFEDSYNRYPYKEYYYFIAIIRLNLSKGGQMREVVTRLGRMIADSKKMEQKKRAMTSEARMSAFIVACMPLAFFIFMRFATPENFDFVINDPSGRLILYYVLGSEILGMLIIWWLMRKST